MFKKSIRIFVLLLAIFGAVFGAVNAQDATATPTATGNGRNGLLREAVQIVSETTGLSNQEIRQALLDGKTVAEIITENGGDVEAVIAQIVTAATERINQAVADGKITQERADQALANLEPNIRTVIIEGELPENGVLGNRPNGGNGGPRPNGGPNGNGGPGGNGGPNGGNGGGMRDGGRFGVIDTIAEQTGMQPREVIQAIRDGKTLAELITENGGDVQAVIDAAVAASTERINQAVTNGRMTQEQADAALANLTQNITDMVNGTTLPEGFGPRGNTGRLINAVAQASSLSAVEVLQKVRDGQTLGAILTEAGVDITAFVDEQMVAVQERLAQQVTDGKLTQEEADARLAERREQVTERLNNSNFPLPAEEAPAGQ